jgi:hypothetical protein
MLIFWVALRNGVTIQKTNNIIFTAVRTSNLVQDEHTPFR